MTAGNNSASPIVARSSDDIKKRLAAACHLRLEAGAFRLLMAILLGIAAIYDIAFLAISLARGWPSGFGDAFALWSFGRFLHAHPAAAIYDPAALHAAQLALGMPSSLTYPFPYPPSAMPLFWLLGLFSGPAAFALFITASLALYLWGSVGPGWRPAAILAALAAPTTMIAIVAGQHGLLTGGLIAGGLRLVGKRPVVAGMLFALASYKPQLGLLIPVALVAARQWRAFAAACGAGAALVSITCLLFGAAAWPGWTAGLSGFSHTFAAESGEILHLMPAVLAGLVRLGVPRGPAELVQAGATVIAAICVWLLFRREPGRLAGAGLMTAAFLATPYAFVYDMPMLATAVIWFIGERQGQDDGFGIGEVLAMMLAVMAPITMVAGGSRFPLAVMALALLLAVIVRHSRSARVGCPPS